MHAPVRVQPKKKKKAFWLKQLHSWHWISSAISLIGLLLFAFTGITLNHAADVEGSPQTVEKSATLPAALRTQVAPDNAPDSKKPLPAPIAAWVEKEIGARVAGEAEWSADEIYLALPSPRRRRLGLDRPAERPAHQRKHKPWLDQLSQRPPQGPQYRRRLEMVHRHFRRRLFPIRNDRPAPPPAPRRQAPQHLAPGRGGLHHPNHFNSSFHSLIQGNSSDAKWL
jgi:hypothetical protein